jgi:hypothetical protein
MLGMLRPSTESGFLMRRQIAIVLALLVVVLPSAAAADDGVKLPTSTVVHAPPGSVVELGRVPIRTDLAGPSCTWTAKVLNQQSVHPGNDVIIRSGQSELTLSGVEDTAGKVTTGSGSVYLVNEVVVLLHMGPDGVFSGGLDLSIHYECTPVTTTTAATTTTTTAAPGTTVASTTTTEVTTTATLPSTTTSIAVLPESVVPAINPSVLPSTGSSTVLGILAAAAFACALGVWLVTYDRSARRRRP